MEFYQEFLDDFGNRFKLENGRPSQLVKVGEFSNESEAVEKLMRRYELREHNNAPSSLVSRLDENLFTYNVDLVNFPQYFRLVNA